MMEVDRPILAAAGTQTSVTVALHPLIIMNISEQWTRTKAQSGGKPVQVIGALLGKQKGRNLELYNSFELRQDTFDGAIIIDKDYFRIREAQYKEVFTELDFLGWYTTGDGPNQSDVALHKQMCEINESPVFVKMNPVTKPSEKLPIHVYESVIDIVEGEACLQFVELNYSLVTEEAERIGVDHVAKISASGAGATSSVTKHLFAYHGAVKMLCNRLKLVTEYLKAVQSGKLPRNEEILRDVASLLNRLPVMDSETFRQEFHNQCNDITLMAYLGVLTKTCGSLNQGLFCDPCIQNPDDFACIEKRIRRKCDTLVKEARGKYRNRKMVEIFDDLSNTICNGADMMECIRLLHPKEEWAEKAEETMARLTELVESMNTNQALYSALKKVHVGGDIVETDEIDKRVTELFLIDFEASGVHLPAETRSKFVELSQEIYMTGAEFTRGADSEVLVSKNDISSLLLPYLKLGRGAAILDGPLGYSSQSHVRKFGYGTFYAVSEKQERLLKRLINARQRLARLVGFDNYSDRVQKEMFLESSENVEKFLNGVIEAISPAVDRDIKELRKIYDETDPGKELNYWDVPYLIGKVRDIKYGINRESYEDYFSLGTLMHGFNQLLGCLYGVKLKYADRLDGEVWAPNVHKLEVYHERTGFVGLIYCDFCNRQGKLGDDCHLTVRCSKLLQDGSYQTPIVVLTLGLENPTTSCNDKPCLLTPGQAENLWHELGHAIHSMLARTRYQHVSGTRCNTDLAEVPSNLMEYFLYDPRVLMKYCASHSTGKMLPLPMAENLCGSRYALSALELQQQALYGLFDLKLHRKDLGDRSTVNFFADLHNSVMPFPHFPGTAWHYRFSHLVPYGAKYYSYLVAKAAAALIWQEVFKKDPFSREKGMEWMRVQSYGGERPTKWLLEKVLGYAPEPMNLVEALQKEVEHGRC